MPISQSVRFYQGDEALVAVNDVRGKRRLTIRHTCLLNADCIDQAFFIADTPATVVGVRYVHSAAGTDGGAVNVQLVKDTGTAAPGAGTDLLTNNSNAGFNCKGTANTVQEGVLVTTAGVCDLNPGDRLALDFAGTVTTLAGVNVVVSLLER